MENLFEKKSVRRVNDLGDLVPKLNYSSDNLYSYDWVNGDTLYDHNDLKIWKELLLPMLNAKKVIVHRDFHIDNLFFLKDRLGIQKCGLIDFQDSIEGPRAYDLVSLLEDARRDVNQKIYSQMCKHP